MHKKNFMVFAANPEMAKRGIEETDDDIARSKFQRDRDRILYSKAFRRLTGKTQVFVVGFNDHLRNRLTHTLEVAQIATTITRDLNLNIDLTEAIALGHDIGHTPFGHIGERTLNDIMNGCAETKDFMMNIPEDKKGFKHNWQSIRILQDLEKGRKGLGLNLTDHTLWGILHHTKLEYNDKTNLGFYEKNYNKFLNDSWSVEGIIVGLADEIAQRHHDIEDGLVARIIDKDELLAKFTSCFRYCRKVKEYDQLIKLIELEKNAGYCSVLFSRLIINFMSVSLLKNLEKNLLKLKKTYEINNSNFYKVKEQIKENKNEYIFDLLNFPKDFRDKDKIFKQYLKERILNSNYAQMMDGKANYLIRQLFKAYITNPQQLSDHNINLFLKTAYEDEVMLDVFRINKEFLKQLSQRIFPEKALILEKYLNNTERYFSKKDLIKILKILDFNDEEISIVLDYSIVGIGEVREQLRKLNKNNYSLARTICDYIAGMTDKYALEQYDLLYGTAQLSKYY